MNKKVLIISSSPRKGGNSDVLCDQFMLGAIEAQNEVEKIFLCDKKVNYCTGCGFCNQNDYSGCSQKDDAPQIVEKMIESDVIVLATPVYFYTMNGQLKTLIDRCCSKYTKIKNKEFYFILSAADENKHSLERTVNGLNGFLACLEGAKEKGVIWATGVWGKGEIKNTGFMDEAYKMGKEV